MILIGREPESFRLKSLSLNSATWTTDCTVVARTSGVPPLDMFVIDSKSEAERFLLEALQEGMDSDG